MKRIPLFLGFCLIFVCAGTAQQGTADQPASKEDVEKYLQIVRSKDMVNKTLDAMSKPMHQMIHEQYLNEKEKLPPDFEARMNRMMDDSMKDFPFDEMLQSMVPVYQKHFTKSDIDALVAFYSTPTGQKVLQETPAIMAETMQTMMPMLQKHVEAMNRKMKEQIAEMKRETEAKAKKSGSGTTN